MTYRPLDPDDYPTAAELAEIEAWEAEHYSAETRVRNAQDAAPRPPVTDEDFLRGAGIAPLDETF